MSGQEQPASEVAPVVEVPTPPSVTKSEPGGAVNKDTPLGKLTSKLNDIIAKAEHNEMYGVELVAPTGSNDLPVPTQIILQKFLRANTNDADQAATQLLKALAWRKGFQPQKAVDEVFDKSRFAGLGYVLDLEGVPNSTNAKDIAVFNIYGAVKDNKKTFGDLDGFIRWRVALHEMTVLRLDIASATTPIPSYGEGPDPYLAYQVHDYLSVSFLRQAPEVKAASTKTIQLFSDMYPETVSRKFFVNVPMFMQWMFGAMQVFMSKDTVAKMKWMSYGTELYRDLGTGVPKSYGGSGRDLDQGVTPKYDA